MSNTLEKQIIRWNKAKKLKHKPKFISLSDACEIYSPSQDSTDSCLFCVLVVKYPASSLIISSINNNLYCTYSDSEGITEESYKADIILQTNKDKLYVKISAIDDSEFNDVYLTPETSSENICITLIYQLADTSYLYCSNFTEAETYIKLQLKNSDEKTTSSPYKLFCNLLSTIDYEAFKLHKEHNTLSNTERNIENNYED